MQLHEQYRPQTWSDVVGQDKAIATLAALEKRGLGGRAYWMSGLSGTGKTTIARLLAAEIADDYAIDEIDAETLTPTKIQELARQMRCKTFGKGGWAVIVNESHGLKAAVVRQLLNSLESIPQHAIWVFTTTLEGQAKVLFDKDDGGPLLSRCQRIELEHFGVARAYAQKLKAAAELENLDGQPIEVYEALFHKHGGNMRAAYQEIEAGVMIKP